jgi:hypothetical protein
MKVVSLTALGTGRIYPPENIPATHIRDFINPRKVYINEKISMTPSGIETATFLLVAQCLSQLQHRVPHFFSFLL